MIRVVILSLVLAFTTLAEARPPITFWWPLTNAPKPQKAFVERVNDLSAAMDLIDGGGASPPAVARTGKAALSSSGAYVTLFEITPGNSKLGAFTLQVNGESARQSRLRVVDRIGYTTSVAGVVTLSGAGNNPVVSGVVGVPATPAAPGLVISAGSVAVSWVTLTGVYGSELQVSTDGGATWALVGNKRYGSQTSSAVFRGAAGPSAGVSFRLRQWNSLGFSAFSVVASGTTGASHGSFPQVFAIDTSEVPVTSVTWNDLAGGYFFGTDGGVVSDCTVSSANMDVQALPSTNIVRVRARTCHGQPAVVQWVVDAPPTMTAPIPIIE